LAFGGLLRTQTWGLIVQYSFLLLGTEVRVMVEAMMRRAEGQELQPSFS